MSTPTAEPVTGVERTAVEAAASLVREYVDSGGQAHEVIRADRYLQAALADSPAAVPGASAAPEGLRGHLATIREHHRVEQALGEAAQRRYVSHVGILLEIIDSLVPGEAPDA